jgi:feruloyl esterase
MPGNSVNYYQSVDKMGGAAKSMDSIRLFMVPGMGHCRGGEGPDTFDAVSALRRWVEEKRAPDEMVASRIRNGAVDRTRPLCPYPQAAKYKGTGSTDEAANFACQAP